MNPNEPRLTSLSRGFALPPEVMACFQRHGFSQAHGIGQVGQVKEGSGLLLRA